MRQGYSQADGRLNRSRRTSQAVWSLLDLEGAVRSGMRYFTSSFFLIRRSSMKHSAVVVQITQPNMIKTFISMTAGSLPAFVCTGTQICKSTSNC